MTGRVITVKDQEEKRNIISPERHSSCIVVGSLETKFKHGSVKLIEGDITDQSTEAVVNAANSSLMGGGGVDGAIHRAGGPAILEECKRIVGEIGRLPPGKAVITTAGNMRATYVIHTVGPVWRGGGSEESATLDGCYSGSLALAKEHGIRTISFPSISTGAYGYPLGKAAEVALGAVVRFLMHDDGVEEVVFVLWGKEALRAYEEALEKLSEGR